MEGENIWLGREMESAMAKAKKAETRCRERERMEAAEKLRDMSLWQRIRSLLRWITK